MHAASLEADYRASIPPTGRAATGAGDLFAELLRHHADEPRPEARSNEAHRAETHRAEPHRNEMRRAETHRAETHQAERGDRSAEARPAREPATASASASTPEDEEREESAADRAPTMSTVAAPDKESAAATPAGTSTSGAVPEAASPTDVRSDAPAVQQAAAAVSPAPLPEGVGGTDATVGIFDTKPAPAISETGIPAAAPRNEATPVAPATVTGTTAADASPARPAPAQPATGPGTSAPPPASDLPPAGPGVAANGAAGTATSGAAGSTAELPIERAPAATAANGNGQGLGKLGSGAEVALAAQAIGNKPLGDADQPARKPDARPSAATQPPGGSPAPQAASASGTTGPAAGTQVTANAQGAGQVNAQPGTPTAIQAGGAATGTAAEEDPGISMPGTFADSLLRAAGGAGTVHAAARPHVPPPSPAAQLAVHVQRAVGDGSNRITVQLHPVELGQIEVRLEFTDDRRVSATVLADRADTLDMLQRDARTLERALQDSGLKADSGSLRFDLRDFGRQGQGFHHQGFGQGFNQTAGQQGGGDAPSRDTAKAPAGPAPAHAASGGTRDSGVDIHV